MSAPRRLCLLLFALFIATMTEAHAADNDVTVYRCQARDGHISLRDTPCLPGELQEVRSMVRPSAPPPQPAAPTIPATPQAPPPAQQAVREIVVVRTPIQPMYECVNAESGDRYTSDNDEGSPRLVPIWTFGYPYPINTWVRDRCQMLPQQEVCARLSDRKYEIMRRYNSALQSERHTLDLEQRHIEARMANDCET